MLYYIQKNSKLLSAKITNIDSVSVAIFFNPKDENEDTLEFSEKIFNRLKDLNLGEIQSIFKEPTIFSFDHGFDPRKEHFKVLRVINIDHKIMITTRLGLSGFTPSNKTDVMNEEITNWVSRVTNSFQLILDKLVDEISVVDDELHFHVHVYKSGNGDLKRLLSKLGISIVFDDPDKINEINNLGIPVEYKEIYGSFELMNLDFEKEEVKFEIDMFVAVEFQKHEKIDLLTTLNILEERFNSYIRDLNE